MLIFSNTPPTVSVVCLKGVKRNCLAVLLLLVVMYGVLYVGASQESSKFVGNPNTDTLLIIPSHTPSAPILILSNEDFETQSWPGDGTEENPYRISDLIIDSNSTQWSGISIHDTTVHFVIENCILLWSGVYCSTSGIYFGNVTLGAVKNCTVYSKLYGIVFYKSSFCSIEKCTVHDNRFDGIKLQDSHNCIVALSTASDNGNEAGIFLQNSQDCFLFNITASGNNAGFLIIGSNVTLVNCTAYDNDSNGFRIAADNSIVSDNLAYFNAYSGIMIGASNCNVFRNRVHSSGTGIDTPTGEYNRIYYNEIGPSLGPENAYDTSANNIWDDGVSLGNYWSDYAGFGGYIVKGSAKSVDRYPAKLEVAPVIDHPPDIEYEAGSVNHSITWSPSGLCSDDYEIRRNGTTIEYGDWDGSPISISVDGLDPASYIFTLIVYDTSHNQAADSVIVTVTGDETTTSSTTSITPTSPSPDSLIPLIMVGGVAILAVIATIFFMRHRDSQV